MLLSNCPILELLHIIKDSSDDIETLNVNSSSLKKFQYFDLDRESKVVINAPNLDNLSISVYKKLNIEVKTPSSIVKAWSYLTRLTRLIVYNCGDEWSYLPVMLCIAPNLKFISFLNKPYCTFAHMSSAVEMKPEQNVALCLKSSLESVEFRGLRDVSGDLEVIAYFLKYAKLLNNVAITCCDVLVSLIRLNP
ncbi:uncharacterized protein LOC126660542 [Mercurialis annua]|uniref:uncharacterized protein LOC126660542 n=1 Tax=Mercurialis annua TaxID=3986 RepID=UPI0021610686|nr:uncharacterized protein LOC126660542 [Mercurialis annua]